MLHLIGLGKMGLNLMQNFEDNNIKVKAYDKNLDVKKSHPNLNIVETLESLVDNNDKQVYWMMLPQGEITEKVFLELCEKIHEDSIIIDGGNANYKESIRRFNYAKAKGIHFLDIGVSGGREGARHGACMMVGGEPSTYKEIQHLIEAVCVNKGALYVGAAGSGHYLKMVHNGIEYGMMQSIAEGFNILHNNDLYDLDLGQISELFNNGSVIRGWLMELLGTALKEDAKLENIAGVVGSSGEGLWTIEEALRLGLNAPVITQSLLVRFASNDKEKFGEKVTASLRNQFGGHSITEVEG